MEQVLNFLATNYVLIVVIAIVILLAIIGYFADETNFGQPKESKINNQPKDENNSDFYSGIYENNNLTKPSVDNLNKSNNQSESKQVVSQENNQSNNNIELNSELINNINNNLKANTELINNMNNNLNENNKLISGINNNLNSKLTDNYDSSNKEVSNSFNSYDNLNKQLDELLPKKDIIETDILDSIDDLSLEKTQKFSFENLENLGDIELPSIKKVNNYNEDIWKL